MLEKVLKINIALGLHMRPAGNLAKIASSLSSEIKILYKDKIINAKSVLNIMSAAIKFGDEITIQVSGENEEEDIKVIVDAIENKTIGE